MNALDRIGHRPLLHLIRAIAGPMTVLAKAQFLQLDGSQKDRAAHQIVRSVLQQGQVAHAQAVVARTNGNFGAGLAVVGALRAHPVVTVMLEGNSAERRRKLKALGAEGCWKRRKASATPDAQRAAGFLAAAAVRLNLPTGCIQSQLPFAVDRPAYGQRTGRQRRTQALRACNADASTSELAAQDGAKSSRGLPRQPEDEDRKESVR